VKTAAAAFAILLAAGTAWGGDLDAAQKKIDDIDYEAARDLIDGALDQGGLDRVQLARAYRMAGEVAAALGDAAAAEEHFVHWLVLDPRGRLDAGVSPRIAEPFAAAKARVDILGALKIDVTVERNDARAHVSVDARDPLQMIAGMKVSADGGGREETGGLTADVAVPDRATVVTVTLVDAHGNVLAIETAKVGIADGLVVTGGGGGGGGGHAWPTLVRWPTWTGFAVLAAGVGGYFTWQVGKDEDALTALNESPGTHTFDEAQAIRDRGDTHALYANIAFGVAGAAAIAAVLTYVLEPSDNVEVAPSAGLGGAGVSATLHF